MIQPCHWDQSQIAAIFDALHINRTLTQGPRGLMGSEGPNDIINDLNALMT